MNAVSAIEADPRLSALAKLREPFPHNQISKLPKPTKAQNDAVKADFKNGMRCPVCGGWHHKDVVHLDYVGHAALTDRLLDADPEWTWEPVAFGPDGQPARDATGGMWIKLTIAGVTRFGYGSADGKSGGDAIKEIIGDALRNAAMRFGAALDLWHKGDLHVEDDVAAAAPASGATAIDTKQCAELRRLLKLADSSEDAFVEWLKCGSLQALAVDRFDAAKKALTDRVERMRAEKARSATAATADLADEIPY